MSNTDVPLRVDVPITLYPDVLANEGRILNEDKTVGPKVHANGREALATMQRTYSAIEDAERALRTTAATRLRRQKPDGTSEFLGDLRIVDGRLRRFHGHEDELAAAATEAVARATASVVSRLDLLTTYRGSLAKKVAEAMEYPQGKTPEGLTQATEIRAHVARLNKARTQFLTTAIEAGDRQTVAAILAAPPFLSGLTEKEQSLLRARATSAWAPEDSRTLEAVDTVIARVQHGKRLLEQRRAKAVALADGKVAQAGRKLEELQRG